MAPEIKLKKIKVADYSPVRVHPELVEKLKELADEDDRSLTKYLERVIKEHVNGK